MVVSCCCAYLELRQFYLQYVCLCIITYDRNLIPIYADVVETADTLDSKSSTIGVRVQVPPSAPYRNKVQLTNLSFEGMRNGFT